MSEQPSQLPSPQPDPKEGAPSSETGVAVGVQAQSGALKLALARVKARAALIEWVTALLYGLAAVFGALFAALWLLAGKQEWARGAGWSLALFYGLLAIIAAFARSRFHASNDVLAARRLGAAHPTRASDLVSAVELAGLGGSALTKGQSSALASAHVQEMSQKVRQLDLRQAVPTRPIYPAALLLGVVLLAHFGVQRWGGERFEQALSHLLFRSLESAELFAKEPIAGDISLTYRYPVYMGRESSTVLGTAGDIHAPKGTEVEFLARADREVAQAFAHFGNQVLPLEVDGRMLSGKFVVSGAGEWWLRFASPSGRTVAEGPPRPVVIEPDAFPTVRIVAPEAEVEVQGDESLKIEYEALDDYGLGKLELVYTFARSGEQVRKELSLPGTGARRVNDSSLWELVTLRLRAGDRVSYHLEVSDNDNISGPKIGVSSSQVLKVFSAIEHNQEVLRRAEEQWERLIVGLADRLEESPVGKDGSGASEEWAERNGAVDLRLSALVADIRGLAAELIADERAPPEIGRALAHVGERVGEAVDKTTQARRRLTFTPSSARAQSFSSTLAREIDEEEKGILFLEDLFDRRKLMDLAELSRELQESRQDLSSLIEQHRNAPDDDTRRAILNEVAHLKSRMHELYRRMREMAKGIQDEHVNREAESMLDEGEDALSQLDEIQKSLAAGDDEAALKALEKLQEQLEKMEQDFRENAGEPSDEQREIAAKLRHLASDLLDLEADQEVLRRQTEEIQQKAQQAQRERLEELKKDFVEKQKKRLEKAQQSLEGMDRQVVERLSQDEVLDTALERVAQAKQALELGDFDEALEQVEAALRHDQALKMRLGLEQDTARRLPSFYGSPEQVNEAHERTKEAEKPLRETARDLDELMRQANEQLSSEDRSRLNELAKKQEAMQQRSEKLQEQLDEIGEQMPLFGPQEGGLLGEAAQKMAEAGSSLGESNPRGAANRQGQALEKLSQLKEAMRQGQGEGGEGGVPMPFGAAGSESGGDGEGRGFRSEQVEIPSADKSKAPEEFRRDILDAMKDETPERYRERVREYYEDLVK